MDNTIYDCSYFIRKFEAIPENMWCIGALSYNNKSCALGFCGAKPEKGVVTIKMFPEASALYDLFKKFLGEIVFHTNDGVDSRYKQPTPSKESLQHYTTSKKCNRQTPFPHLYQKIK